MRSSPVNRCAARRALGRLALVLAAPLCAHAQSEPEVAGTPGRMFSIVPSISITETLTDNSGLTSSNRRSDLITQVSPGLRITSTGGRVRGFLDYALSGVLYARGSASNEFQNFLSAAANVEAVENWAYVDVASSISQQVVSAFGTRSTDPSLTNPNQTETRTFSLSPYVRGTLAGAADYEARLTRSSTSNDAASASDVTTTQASLRIGQRSSLAKLGWSADASHQVVDFSAGRQTENDQIRGVLSYAIDPELRFSAIGGYEANNYVSLDKEGHRIWGLGADWTPSERTRLSASTEDRFFGKSHSLVFQHRSARTAWTFSDTRDVSTGFDQPTLGTRGTAFDLFFSLFASQQPDPLLRARLVEEFLLAAGIPRDAVIFSGSSASAVTLQRRQEVSLALLGLRDTVVLSASQSKASRLDSVVVVSDDFANGNVVRERGLNATWSHRLTPQTALSVTGSISRASGTVGNQSTNLRTIFLAWSGRLGPRTSFSLGARRAAFRGSSEPYDETAVTATLSFQL